MADLDDIDRDLKMANLGAALNLQQGIRIAEQQSKLLELEKETVEQQKKIVNALEIQQKERAKVKAQAKCPKCALPVENRAKLCPSCNTAIAVIGPLVGDYCDDLMKSKSGRIAVEVSQAETTLLKIHRAILAREAEMQRKADLWMRAVAGYALPFRLLEHPDAAPVRDFLASEQATPKEAEKPGWEIGCAYLVVVFFWFVITVVLERYVLKPAGLDGEYGPFLALFFFVGAPVLLLVWSSVAVARLEQDHVRVTTDLESKKRRAVDFLNRSGCVVDLVAVKSRQNRLLKHFVGSPEFLTLSSYFADFEVVTKAFHRLSLEIPAPLNVRCAFIGDEAIQKESKGRVIAAAIWRECGKYVPLPDLFVGTPVAQDIGEYEPILEDHLEAEPVIEDDVLEVEPILEFWLKRGDKLRGPVSRKVVVEALEKGQLAATDLIATHKNGRWVALSEGVREYGFN